MMFILFIIFLIHKSQSLEWNCTEIKHYLFSNDQIYEQCTITIEYISSEQQQQKQICITHSLSIKTLPSISFLSNYKMHTFKINSCQLLTLNQLPFLLPSSVEYLDLSYNLLTTFTLSFPLPLYLKYLRLDNNPNLININFGHNHIQEQLIGLSLRHNKHIKLTSLPLYLQQLDLTNCNLLQSSSILLLLKTLTKLTHLSLANNQLKQLPIFNNNIQLEYLNLSNNYLTFINNEWLHKSLKIFDLKFNQIESLEFFHELLKINRTLKDYNYNQTMNNNNNILQLSLHGNPLICDCWFGSIVDSSLINITDLSLLQCNSHSIMNISQNNFLCSYSQYCSLDCSCCDFEACDCHSICPSECLCLHNSLWSNHIVQCQQKKLSNIHIHLPETITELNYEENNIEQLQSFIFIGKNLLTKLNLAKNNIKNLTNDIFCGASNLYEINLSYNKNLIIKLSNINILFSCLKYLQYIILSKEQINKDEEIINIGWIIESNNDIIRLIRINEKLSLSTYNIYTIPISTNIYPLIQSEIQSTTSFSIYHQQSLISSNFIQHNQTFIIIIFFLLLFLLLFLLFLILLAICRRKFRHHLKTELQRQRSHHYYYHTNLHQSSIQIPNSNGTNGVNDSVYEQLPSLSSDSEQPFLYNEKKLTNINAPALPPYPPAFRRYHCCHSMNSHDYQYGRNTSTTTSAAAACYSSLNLQQHPCSTVLVLRNPSLYRNHHEYSCELQQCLVSNQQEKNSMICCNNQTSFIPTILCQCNDHIQNIDTCIYPNVHK